MLEAKNTGAEKAGDPEVPDQDDTLGFESPATPGGGDPEVPDDDTKAFEEAPLAGGDPEVPDNPDDGPI